MEARTMAKKMIKTYPYAVIYGGKLIPKNTPIEEKATEEKTDGVQSGGQANADNGASGED
jgi:hypothetical protein